MKNIHNAHAISEIHVFCFYNDKDCSSGWFGVSFKHMHSWCFRHGQHMNMPLMPGECLEGACCYLPSR